MSTDPAPPAGADPPPLLELRDIGKRFGSVVALDGVSFRLGRAEIRALLGENGAGKSTLMKIAFGLVRPDTGEIRVDGARQAVGTPRDARRLGVGMVHQHFTSIPTFTVAENVALAAGWGPPTAATRARLRQLMEQTGIALPPEDRAEDLSAGLKQRLEVLKALAADARILLLDEPTSVLPPSETAPFLALVQSLRERGVSSVLITHKLDEALRIADQVTILRRGRVVRTGPIRDETARSLAEGMLGGGEGPPATPAPRAPGEVLVRLASVRVARLSATGSALEQGTLTAHAGEILGVAAVEGNGQRELLRAIAGQAVATEGSLEVAQPVAFIPEDRTREALIAEFTLEENLALWQGREAPWVRGGWIDWAAVRQRTQQLLGEYGVVARGPEALAGELSGGNQQRVVIASAAERGPRVIVAENPARGLDLRATREVFDRLRAAAAAGAAVVLHLPDLDELLVVADRIVVVARGQTVTMPAGSTREQVGRALLAGAPAAGATG